MSKNVMLRASYRTGRIFELVEKRIRESGIGTQGALGKKGPGLHLVAHEAHTPTPNPPSSAAATRVECVIPLTDNDGQFFAEEQIAEILFTILSVTKGCSLAVGAGFALGETASLDVILWSATVVANDVLPALHGELQALQGTLKQESVFVSMVPASAELLTANTQSPDTKLAG